MAIAAGILLIPNSTLARDCTATAQCVVFDATQVAALMQVASDTIPDSMMQLAMVQAMKCTPDQNDKLDVASKSIGEDFYGVVVLSGKDQGCMGVMVKSAFKCSKGK